MPLIAVPGLSRVRPPPPKSHLTNLSGRRRGESWTELGDSGACPLPQTGQRVPVRYRPADLGRPQPHASHRISRSNPAPDDDAASKLVWAVLNGAPIDVWFAVTVSGQEASNDPLYSLASMLDLPAESVVAAWDQLLTCCPGRTPSASLTGLLLRSPSGHDVGRALSVRVGKSRSPHALARRGGRVALVQRSSRLLAEEFDHMIATSSCRWPSPALKPQPGCACGVR